MKHYMFFLLAALLFLFVGGCQDKEADQTEVSEPKEEVIDATIEEDDEDEMEKLIERLKNYEIVVLEDNGEEHHIRIEYPKFHYEPLDDILSDKEKEFEAQLEQAEQFREEGFDDVYSYQLNVKNVTVTANIVSVYYEGRFYHGGGFSIADSFNYDLKHDRIVTLDDVLEEHFITLAELADLAAEKLMADERFLDYYENPEQLREEVREETKPVESNFAVFTLTDEAITFYKQFFSLFPNAEGMVDVEITWDEMEQYINASNGQSDADDAEVVQSRWIYEFGDPVEATESLQYIDEEYRFTVDLPASWKGKYFVQLTKSDFEHFPKEPSKSIVFNMVHEGKYMGYIFSIEVLEDISVEEVNAYYENWPGFEGLIDAGNDVVLVYSRPGEMEAPLYEAPYIEVGNEFSKMVEEDMPKILKTVKFY